MSFYLLTAFIPTYHLNLAAGLSLRARATINTGLSCVSLHPRPTVPDSVKLLEDENLPGLSLLMLKKAVSATEEASLEDACEGAAGCAVCSAASFPRRGGPWSCSCCLWVTSVPTGNLSPLLLLVALIQTHWFTKVGLDGVFSPLLVPSCLFAPSQESGHVGKQKKQCLFSSDTLASVLIKPWATYAES